jgi:hypothetical protein
MPDLIIKPTNTQGNRVIIQDQAGGAVLTTADSGATFSGGNIGTVTAGTIGSGVTFPSGHILQVVSAGAGDGAKLTTTSQSYVEYSGTGTSVTITPSSTSSKILVTAIGSLVNTYYNKSIFIALARGSSSNIIFEAGAYSDYNQTPARESSVELSTLDSPSTVSAITYKVYIKIAQTSGSVIWGGNFNGSSSNCTTITAMEVKG